jgi:hypothetical protein
MHQGGIYLDKKFFFTACCMIFFGRIEVEVALD